MIASVESDYLVVLSNPPPFHPTSPGRTRLYAITRLKAAKNTWYWKVNFKRTGKLVERRFHDLMLGGEKQAFAVAVAWRDAELKRTKALTKREFHAQKRSNNVSGVPGVHFVKAAAQPQGVWQAKITLADGRKVTKSISVRKFGDKEACKRAVAERTRMLELVEE